MIPNNIFRQALDIKTPELWTETETITAIMANMRRWVKEDEGDTISVQINILELGDISAYQLSCGRMSKKPLNTEEVDGIIQAFLNTNLKDKNIIYVAGNDRRFKTVEGHPIDIVFKYIRGDFNKFLSIVRIL